MGSLCKKEVHPVAGIEEDGDSWEDDQRALVNLVSINDREYCLVCVCVVW